jgi:hypothetical protein
MAEPNNVGGNTAIPPSVMSAPDDSGTQQVAAPTPGPIPAPAMEGAPAVPAQAPQVGAASSQPQPTPEMHAVAHQNVVNKLVSGLLGNQTTYQVDPQTGKTVAVERPQKPGELFRHILAGAILGGAASTGGGGGLGEGAVRGAAAGLQDLRQQDQQKQAQAVKDFEQKRQQQQDALKQKEFESEQKVRDAQIAHFNMETLRTNQIMQGEDFDQHEKVGNAGKVQLQPYLDAGLTPKYENVKEGELPALIQANPNAQNLLWLHTGTTVNIGQDGKPHYESTLTAIDPKGKVPMTAAQLEEFKSVGMDKVYPELKDIKPGRELDAMQMLSLQHQYQKLYSAKQQQTKDAADINYKNAEAAKNLAEASHFRQMAKQAGLEKKQAEIFSGALNELNKVGGDFNKLDPKSRLVIAESTTKSFNALSQMYKDAITNGDYDTAKSILPQIEQLSKLNTAALPTVTTPAAQLPAGNNQPLSDPNIIKQYVAAANGDVSKAQQLAAQNGWVIQGGQKAAPAQADPRANVTPDKTVMIGPGNRTQIIPNDAVQTFLQNNKQYKVLGPGTQQQVAPPPETASASER